MCQGCMGHLRGPSVKPVAFDCIPIEAKLGWEWSVPGCMGDISGKLWFLLDKMFMLWGQQGCTSCEALLHKNAVQLQLHGSGYY